MKLSILSRRLHRWGAVIVALPLILVIGTGLLLQVKKQVPWVQPAERRAPVTAPMVPWEAVLQAARAIPEAGVDGWEDIARVDVRPDKGILKVITTSHWEAQLALGTGEVLQVAYRRSDLVEQLHDGSFFGNTAKLAVFLPSGIILLGLWLTGAYLWLLPGMTKRKRARLEAGAQ